MAFSPSAGVGYLISNEEFFKPLSHIITKLKLKGTYGLVGNDNIGNAKDRFFYLSNVNLDNGDRKYTFWNRFWLFKKMEFLSAVMKIRI